MENDKKVALLTTFWFTEAYDEVEMKVSGCAQSVSRGFFV
jgi:hypothetical protein